MRRTLVRLSARIASELPLSSASCSSSSSAGAGVSVSAASRARTPPRPLYGQPLPHSHPHLFPRTLPFPSPPSLSLSPPSLDVALDELTPGIPAAEYAERRKRLMDSLPEGSAVLVMAGRVKCMSGNINYRFRQDSNFWYLTGWAEPDAALLLESTPSSPKGHRMTLFVAPRDAISELWNGPRNGIDGAMDVFGADQAFAMDPASLQAHLKTLLSSVSHFYLDLPTSPSFPRRSLSRSSSSSSSSSSSGGGNLLTYLTPSASSLDVFSKKTDFEQLVKLLNDSKRTRPLAPHVERLRVKKSHRELAVMRRAGAIGSRGMREVMRFAQPGRGEGQVQATFEHTTSLYGAQRPAYVPVVASGLNALTIHYISNDALLHAGDLVCIDAGPEVDGYVSDITRVFPVSSRFSSAQRDLYCAVLRVLKACTELATAANGYTQGELHRRSVELLRLELEKLGFSLNRSGLLERLYPHSLSHWLGIDLHDTPSIERATRLQEGHVLTIEPAVYVPHGDEAFPSAFWGMGIRIEDDVAVTKEGNVVLSAEAPREVEDVEAACAAWEEGVEREKQRVSEEMRRAH